MSVTTDSLEEGQPQGDGRFPACNSSNLKKHAARCQLSSVPWHIASESIHRNRECSADRLWPTFCHATTALAPPEATCVLHQPSSTTNEAATSSSSIACIAHPHACGSALHGGSAGLPESPAARCRADSPGSPSSAQGSLWLGDLQAWAASLCTPEESP